MKIVGYDILAQYKYWLTFLWLAVRRIVRWTVRPSPDGPSESPLDDEQPKPGHIPTFDLQESGFDGFIYLW